MTASLALTDYRAAAAAAFRRAWMFKGDAVDRIVELLDGAPKPWFHVCCGAARIPGEDVRVDMHHPSADQSWDVQKLDKHVQGVGAIVIDPPYGWDLATRMRAMNACMRALGPGGRLVVHAPWQPQFPKKVMVRRDPVYFRDDAYVDFPLPPIMLVAYEKSRDPRVNAAGGRRVRDQKRRTRSACRRKSADSLKEPSGDGRLA